MRQLRWLIPSAVWFVTNRCEQEQFFLLPGEKRNELIGGWLARALEKEGKGIEIFGFIFMSNHFHILLRDNLGNLSAFMGYFQTNLAKAVNKELNRKKGTIFPDRFDSALVENNEDFIDRLAYTLGNPVKSGLVERCEQWHGLSSLRATINDEVLSFIQFDADAYNKAVKENQKKKRSERKKIKKEHYFRPFLIPITHPPMLANQNPEKQKLFVFQLMKSFEAKWHLHWKDKGGFLGMKKILTAKPTDRPKKPAFSPKVQFFCKDKNRLKELQIAKRLFTQNYREIYLVYKKQTISCKIPLIEWPPWSCPPSCCHPTGYEQEAG